MLDIETRDRDSVMYLATTYNSRAVRISLPVFPFVLRGSRIERPSIHRRQTSSNDVFFRSCFSLSTYARKRNSESELVIKPTIIEEVSADEEDDLLQDDFEDGELLDGEDDFEDEFATENDEVWVGDGAAGGGISLAGTWWDKEALAIAEEVSQSFDSDLKIYAFRTLANATIQVRIEKLSTNSGSPSMSDIESFSSAYRERLDEAELAKSIPENISLEVSSPGVERVVQIPGISTGSKIGRCM
ncbi:hypothetical protein Nepgr_024149 [Nepenthes gracilis]|uniref:Ribosome maturation factor RimP N-terminal domain-containing protein n=1 Tax=Nepenthes gracilis TaxID=150966 RepID=A0AAD3Y070_NEPGR|nr:hypothetical protein Nepgr_024149 [Nepenthes gracilis]